MCWQAVFVSKRVGVEQILIATNSLTDTKIILGGESFIPTEESVGEEKRSFIGEKKL
jgi:hypothetical protein